MSLMFQQIDTKQQDILFYLLTYFQREVKNKQTNQSCQRNASLMPLIKTTHRSYNFRINQSEVQLNQMKIQPKNLIFSVFDTGYLLDNQRKLNNQNKFNRFHVGNFHLFDIQPFLTFYFSKSSQYTSRERISDNLKHLKLMNLNLLLTKQQQIFDLKLWVQQSFQQIPQSLCTKTNTLLIGYTQVLLHIIQNIIVHHTALPNIQLQLIELYTGNKLIHQTKQ
eukprot:TRINITY_DN15982_c0_g2_i1.p1 TRINITY_DN15982_c0_g2~~TRINITY_DN15982_c0_g2_i1.p1  ORF type:complete len:222 (+),score=-12.80 TRINITY_DN15982_c0_g2_i1:237-902(+)